MFNSNTVLNLPYSYMENRLVLMVQSPTSIFAYWDLSPGFIKALEQGQPLLRLYSCNHDTKNLFQGEIVEEITLPPYTANWYFNRVVSGGCYYVELGYRERDDLFVYMLRSNYIETPVSRPRQYGGEAVMMQVLPAARMSGDEGEIATAGQEDVIPMSVSEVMESMSFYMGFEIKLVDKP